MTTNFFKCWLNPEIVSETVFFEPSDVKTVECFTDGFGFVICKVFTGIVKKELVYWIRKWFRCKFEDCERID